MTTDPAARPRIHLLMTGNELMSGVTVDSNSSAIARHLEPLSLDIAGKVTIGDELDRIVTEMVRLAEQSDVLIVNGGLGPTLDDLTAEALARVCGVTLVEHPQAMEHLQDWCGRRGNPLNDANRKQAILPEGCALIPNATGSAVGFRMRYQDCEILCTPGVPSELLRMLDEQIVPLLAGWFPLPGKLVISRFQLFGIGESALQQLLSDALPDWPQEIELGFRAGAPTLELKVTSRDAAHEPLRRDCEARVRDLIGDLIVGEGSITLPQRVLELLLQQGRKVAFAESCTGGLMAAMLTEVAGASQAFEAGFVTYSNAQKESTLGVSADTLAGHGAVSEAVVREMAAGALARSGADYAVAVSGIAGPDGGTEEKPVGTVWLAWGRAGDLRARELFFPYGRKLFQTMVAAAGLDLLRRQLQGLEVEPRYFRERSRWPRN